MAVTSAADAPRKPVVAVDLDEVLAHFLPALCAFHNETYGTALSSDHFRSYRFCETWGGDDAEAKAKVHRFFQSRHFADLPPVAGAYDVLAARRHAFDFFVVTSRQHVIEAETRAWVARHFDGDAIFRGVLMGNHWPLDDGNGDDNNDNAPRGNGAPMPPYYVSKAEMCKRVGATALIDDSPAYAEECARAGMQALVFDYGQQYGWSKRRAGAEPEHERVQRVHNWREVAQYLDALHASWSSSSLSTALQQR